MSNSIKKVTALGRLRNTALSDSVSHLLNIVAVAFVVAAVFVIATMHMKGHSTRSQRTTFRNQFWRPNLGGQELQYMCFYLLRHFTRPRRSRPMFWLFIHALHT